MPVLLEDSSDVPLVTSEGKLALRIPAESIFALGCAMLFLLSSRRETPEVLENRCAMVGSAIF